jgi:hypothetical protein
MHLWFVDVVVCVQLVLYTDTLACYDVPVTLSL